MRMEQFRNIGLIGRLGSARVIDTLKRLKKFLIDHDLNDAKKEKILIDNQ